MRAHITISKLAYFGDFIVIPIGVVALLALAISEGGAAAAGPLALSLGLGLFVLTFVEYVVHRFVYHHTPFFEPTDRSILRVRTTKVWPTATTVMIATLEAMRLNVRKL
jgi:hypothetical protein